MGRCPRGLELDLKFLAFSYSGLLSGVRLDLKRLQVGKSYPLIVYNTTDRSLGYNLTQKNLHDNVCESNDNVVRE